MRSESNRNGSGNGNGKAAVHDVMASPREKTFTRATDKPDLPGTRKLTVCPDCHVLFPATEDECPGCGSTAAGIAQTAGNGKRSTRARNGNDRKPSDSSVPEGRRRAGLSGLRSVRDRRPGKSSEGKGAPRSVADKAARRKAQGTEKIFTRNDSEKSSKGHEKDGAGIRERISGIEISKRTRMGLGILLAVGIAAGAYLLVFNDPEAEVARKSLDRSRPATVKVLAEGTQAINMTELKDAGQEASEAEKKIGEESARVGKLENREYRTVVGEDLAAQRATITPYSALAGVDLRRVSSRRLKALSTGIKEAGESSPVRLAKSQRAVDEVGALAPDGNRPAVSDQRVESSTRRATGVLDGAASKIGAWERRVELWRNRQAARKAELASYSEAMNAAMSDYDTMRNDLDELDRNRLDAMPMPEAEAALQEHRDNRQALLNSQLMPLQPPAALANTHNQLVETVRQGVDGLDAAISAMGDQGNVTYGTDYLTGEEVLFGDYFRDEPEWQTYESTSEANTESLNRLNPQLDREIQAEQDRLDAAKPPKRPAI